MAITMQGSWTVGVKSKEAAYAQRFIISGADSGNGTYEGKTTTPPVYVTGAAWSITIQHNPGTGFIDSVERIKWPKTAAGQYQFDIESNDTGGDKDFNDLILSCSTPQTLTDFLIYGNVSYYSGNCVLNPCYKFYAVIDSHEALHEALKNPHLKDAIKWYYPDRLVVERPKIGPFPDPPPIRPLVIPLQDASPIPPRMAQVLKLSEIPAPNAPSNTKGARAASVTLLRSFALDKQTAVMPSYDRIAFSRLVDKFRLFCTTGPLPGIVLRFQEYDRTSAELSGGAYTGEGNREDLGVCATDSAGNYIFRFSRSIAEFLSESATDIGEGEDAVVQAQPDLIAQILDFTKPGGVAFETAPRWNVPLLKRIDICVPKSKVGPPPPCQGENAIQAIGNILIGAPVGSTRVGYNNFLGSEGRITARNAVAGVPQARCAAWVGYLDFFACFLGRPEVTQYSIRHRRRLADLSWTAWAFFQETYLHAKVAKIGLPGYSGDQVGPFDRMLHVGGGPAVLAKAYDNIENDGAWIFTKRDRKAVISSWLYAPEPGPVQFRIEGYDAAGNLVAGAQDTITLYIDNSHPQLEINAVDLQGQAGGECALFTLPAGQLNAPLTVKFRANQFHGFLNAFQLSVRKGNTSGFAITGSGPGQIQASYVHGDDLLCSELHGTLDDPTSDAFGYVTADISPASGDWLSASQSFCTFAINLGCTTRVTNGYNWAVYEYGPVQYLLGLQK